MSMLKKFATWIAAAFAATILMTAAANPLIDQAKAQGIIDNWASARSKFVKVFPNEYRRALGELAAKGKKIAA